MAKETKAVRAPSVKSLRRQVETNLLTLIRDATANSPSSPEAAVRWMEVYEKFQASENGAKPTALVVESTQSGLPLEG